ncbi:hypothetical protein Ct61P_13937 [Colletotrichum tofieldiae]|nr:hypothetical protein Ct61P_13937 [Colletotrichum tofieldiae]
MCALMLMLVRLPPAASADATHNQVIGIVLPLKSGQKERNETLSASDHCLGAEDLITELDRSLIRCVSEYVLMLLLGSG